LKVWNTLFALEYRRGFGISDILFIVIAAIGLREVSIRAISDCVKAGIILGTSLTSVTRVLLFLTSLGIAPFISAVSGTAMAPALIFVGALILSDIRDMDFSNKKAAPGKARGKKQRIEQSRAKKTPC